MSGPVELTIRDARGALVRTYSSDAAAQSPDLTRSVIAPEWLAAPARLGADPGAHRFVWDLRYALRPPLAGQDGEEPEQGVWAPPGDYSVELAAGGREYHQQLRVAPDPRVALPAAAYARQFALARDIESARVEIAAALAEAARIDTAMHASHQVTGPDTGAALIATLAAAEAQLRAISDAPPEKRSPDSTGLPPTTVAGLRYLEGAFRGLAHAVDGADAAPSADAQRGYLRHRALLDAALARWAAFKRGTLVRLNTALAAIGDATINP